MANKYQPSKIQKTCECYLCHGSSSKGLEHHHCLHGTGQRKLADEDGLWVWLCRKCHSRLHDFNEHDKELQLIAQQTYIQEQRSKGFTEEIGRNLFRERYGRFYD